MSYREIPQKLSAVFLLYPVIVKVQSPGSILPGKVFSQPFLSPSVSFKKVLTCVPLRGLLPRSPKRYFSLCWNIFGLISTIMICRISAPAL